MCNLHGLIFKSSLQGSSPTSSARRVGCGTAPSFSGETSAAKRPVALVKPAVKSSNKRKKAVASEPELMIPSVREDEDTCDAFAEDEDTTVSLLFFVRFFNARGDPYEMQMTANKHIISDKSHF